MAGCRCDACKSANVRHYHERQRKIAEQESEVRPSGPPIPGTLIRAGRVYKILRCPGANGKRCVVKGKAWLRGAEVCRLCVARATVWDGLVPADRARKHLLDLQAKGVGTRSIAAACSVGRTALKKILDGKEKIRFGTEKQILSVNAAALADGAPVDATEANQLITAMLLRGFKKNELARLLGSTAKTPSLQLGEEPTMTLANSEKVKRLARKIESGDVAPKAWGSVLDVRELVRRGVRVPPLKCSPTEYDNFLFELRELAELRKQEAYPRKSNLEIINLSQFRDHT